MLRILDARTGEPVDAALSRHGLVRVHARPPGSGITGLRVLLVADVLVRALEIGGNTVWATLTSAPDPAASRGGAGLRAHAAELGIRPFEDHRDTEEGPTAAWTVDVVAQGAATTDGPRVEVAPVDSGSAPVPGDPTALRLALLARRRDLPLSLDAGVLAEAEDTLGRWRAAVAGWAARPSRPVPEDVRLRLRAAWEGDLDVPAVLDVLRSVEDSDIPEGARFETYAYADRLLGLELTREIGAAL
ncbi:hypothetical protein CW362_26155 [Streptomyces populi]|uniref:Cysteinyl-tRNA synthetase n=1 Tax=Streptomyces populi TaxID=2058924 RepID=A0A2I0SJI2_9ACTN|nr:hypothetical protein [Streptomyces populi]PKT70088.1 hypothetical protein CW362_26155 [Streptomyces populi]